MKSEDDPITPDEWLIRRVRVEKFRTDEAPIISPNSFEPRTKGRDVDTDGISLYRAACLADESEALASVPVDHLHEYGIVRIPVSMLEPLGLSVESKKDDRIKGHVVLPELSHVISSCRTTRFYDSSEWLAAWQFYAERLVEFAPRETPCEWLNRTSSINNDEFDPFIEAERFSTRFEIIGQAAGRLGDLFSHVLGNHRDWPVVKFLRSLGIRSWESLRRPVRIDVQRFDGFPSARWFDVRGRVFAEPQNDCHKAATWVMSGRLRFSRYRLRWTYELEYGYAHDSSHWFYGVQQERREHISSFSERVNKMLDDKLLPEDQWRKTRDRQWSDAYLSLRGLFFDDYRLGDWKHELADHLSSRFTGGIGSGKIELDARRLATLKRWIASDAESLEKKNADAAKAKK